MIHGGDTVAAFAAAGWRWGGYWSGSKDYQHPSSTGRRPGRARGGAAAQNGGASGER